jgi:hypothetical protein
VECALKSVIAGRTRQHEFPDLGVVKRAYTHDLEELLNLSDLNRAIHKEFVKDPTLRKNWVIVIEWNETSRYEAGHLRKDAESLYTAIADPAHGVLSCISRCW